MDGTIYNGQTLFRTRGRSWLCSAISGIGYTFLTNNPSKNRADYLAHLRKLGVAARPEQIYTSAHATIEYLHEKWRKCGGYSSSAPPACAGSSRPLILHCCPRTLRRSRMPLLSASIRRSNSPVSVAPPGGSSGANRICDQSGPGLSDRPADGAGRLRLDLRGSGKGHGRRSRRRAGQTRPGHDSRHSPQTFAQAPSTGDGGRPALHRHHHGASCPGAVCSS